MSFLECRRSDSLVRYFEFARLVRAWRHDLIESQSTILGLGRTLGGEVFVDFDLILEVMLLDASGIARSLSWRFGVVSNVVF